MSEFGAVVGQDAAVSRLRAAAQQPVHAYLFLGPLGSGKKNAAAAFAAAVFSTGDVGAAAADRNRRLALSWKHPDVFFFEPEGRTLRVKEAEHLGVEASRSPVEGRRKIIVCDRFHTAEPGAAANLLKTIEEPPPTSMFVLLAEEVPPEHITIASRCTTIDFGAVSHSIIVGWLTDQGTSPEAAELAAMAARGDLRRARLLANDPDVADRHRLWSEAPDRLDGTGAAVVVAVEEIRAAIDRAQAPLDDQHREELDGLLAAAEQIGVTATQRREMESRHKRETRRLRDDELRFGLAVLAARYRAAVDEGHGRAALGAIDLLRELSRTLARNPNEALQMNSLFLRLPSLK